VLVHGYVERPDSLPALPQVDVVSQRMMVAGAAYSSSHSLAFAWLDRSQTSAMCMARQLYLRLSVTKHGLLLAAQVFTRLYQLVGLPAAP